MSGAIRSGVMTLTDLLVCMECVMPAAVAGGMAYLELDVQVARLVEGFVAQGNPMFRVVLAGSVTYLSTALAMWLRMRLFPGLIV